MWTKRLQQVSLGSALFIMTTLGFAQSVKPQEPLAVKIASGTVIGTSRNALESWQGIPYARAPIGELRWHTHQQQPFDLSDLYRLGYYWLFEPTPCQNKQHN